jgi:polysaccharide deacetylase family protein (PEP-CTERM system associated)
MTNGSQVHAMTCDVEDYFQVSAFEGVISRSRWPEIECRIPRNIDKILQAFGDSGAKATFFTLGWVAERHPEVIQRIVGEGHELASHGMCHRRVWTQSPDEFRQDASQAREILEDVSGTKVSGYRAASWSIDERTPWAHQILSEVGYSYSSSVYPVSHDHYGLPSSPRHPHRVKSTGLTEVPPSTTRILGRNIPVSGGGYFRLFPLGLSKSFIRRHQQLEAYPYVFYFHPWEMDPEQPRVAGISLKSRFRHYLNLGKFEYRLGELLHAFNWGRMDEVFFPEGQNNDDDLRHPSADVCS